MIRKISPREPWSRESLLFNLKIDLYYIIIKYIKILTIGNASNAYTAMPKKSGNTDQPENFGNSSGFLALRIKWTNIDKIPKAIKQFAIVDTQANDESSFIIMKITRIGHKIRIQISTLRSMIFSCFMT